MKCYPYTIRWNPFIKLRYFCSECITNIRLFNGSVATNSFYMFACVTVHKLKTASYTTDLSVWVIRISFSNISFVMLWCLWSRKIVFSLQLLRMTWRWLHLQWKQWYKALSYKCGTLLSCVVCSDNFGDFDVPRAKHCKTTAPWARTSTS